MSWGKSLALFGAGMLIASVLLFAVLMPSMMEIGDTVYNLNENADYVVAYGQKFNDAKLLHIASDMEEVYSDFQGFGYVFMPTFLGIIIVSIILMIVGGVIALIERRKRKQAMET